MVPLKQFLSNTFWPGLINLYEHLKNKQLSTNVPPMANLGNLNYL